MKITEQTQKACKMGDQLGSLLVRFCLFIDRLTEEIEEVTKKNDISTAYNQKYLTENERADNLAKLIHLKSLRNKDIFQLNRFLVDN